MKHFDHERLDVYRTSLEFVAFASRLAHDLPKGNAHITKQLDRAAISIPLNIAEGAGEFSRNDKARFYRIALRSTTECAAILDVCRHLHLVPDERTDHGRSLLLRITSMLTVMAKRLGREPSGTGTGSGTGTEGQNDHLP